MTEEEFNNLRQNDLSSLYTILLKEAKRELQYLINTKKIYPIDVNSVAHDAVTVFIEQKCLTKQPRITHPFTYLKYCIKSVIYGDNGSMKGDPTQRRLVNKLSEQDKEQEITYDHNYISYFKQDPWVIYFLWKYDRYKISIQWINKIKDKQWIYEHAVPLRRTWLILHRRREYERKPTVQDRAKG